MIYEYSSSLAYVKSDIQNFRYRIPNSKPGINYFSPPKIKKAEKTCSWGNFNTRKKEGGKSQLEGAERSKIYRQHLPISNGNPTLSNQTEEIQQNLYIPIEKEVEFLLRTTRYFLGKINQNFVKEQNMKNPVRKAKPQPSKDPKHKIHI